MSVTNDRLTRALNVLLVDHVQKLCQKFGVPLLDGREKKAAIERFVQMVSPSRYEEVFMACDLKQQEKIAKALNLAHGGSKSERARRIAQFVAQGASSPHTGTVSPVTVVPGSTVGTQKKRVFIVHGHDDLMKEQAARIIESFGLEAVILHEQANRGKTIIEKLEYHSSTDYALVLLTPDDVGAVKAASPTLRPRARQNVIFEFGLFIGKLGRERVAVLHRADIELPTDLTGIVYIPCPGQVSAVKGDLEKELKGAGML